MKQSLILLSIACCICVASVAEAKIKIGVVNLQRAVSETKEGKAAESKLRSFKKKKEAELNRKLKQFYKKEQELRKAWSVLKEADRRKRAMDSRKKFQALQKEYVTAERNLLKLKAKMMMKIQKKLNVVIQRIAKREKYDYIFNNAALLWAPRHTDLTNQVIREFR